MDKLRQSLKNDAEAIDAEVSPELQTRIDASVRAMPMLPAEPQTHSPGGSLWWASSLTGLAAAMLLIVFISWNRGTQEPVSPQTFATEPAPDEVLEIPIFPLTATPADLTEPLEDELRNLQSDIEKARESVARDLRSSF